MKQQDLPIIIPKIKEVYKIVPRPVATFFQENTKDPFKVLISTILSPRAKDQQTEKISLKLFKVADTPEKLSNLTLKEIEKIIYSIGFYHSKAKRVKEASKMLIEKHNSKVPETLNELIELPGVGRKVANIILAECFNKDVIAVDIHCHRIPNRWGLIKTKDPYETEQELEKVLQKTQWKYINRYLVAFGQNICLPISPKCSKCPIEKYCKKIDVKTSR